jgi:hypothetical protein
LIDARDTRDGSERLGWTFFPAFSVLFDRSFRRDADVSAMLTQTESLRLSPADSGLATGPKGFELGAIIGGSAIVLLAIVAAV